MPGGRSAALRRGAVGADLLGRTREARALGGANAVVGGYLGSYTGVLLASTAVPVWARSRTVPRPDLRLHRDAPPAPRRDAAGARRARPARGAPDARGARPRRDAARWRRAGAVGAQRAAPGPAGRRAGGGPGGQAGSACAKWRVRGGLALRLRAPARARTLPPRWRACCTWRAGSRSVTPGSLRAQLGDTTTSRRADIGSRRAKPDTEEQVPDVLQETRRRSPRRGQDRHDEGGADVGQGARRRFLAGAYIAFGGLLAITSSAGMTGETGARADAVHRGGVRARPDPGGGRGLGAADRQHGAGPAGRVQAARSRSGGCSATSGWC